MTKIIKYTNCKNLILSIGIKNRLTNLKPYGKLEHLNIGGLFMDIRAMARAAGLTDNELKGKSPKELIKLLTGSLKEQEKTIEIEAGKEYIGNYEKKLPKVIEALKEPFEVYVKSIGQKKSPTPVKVVGYNKDDPEGKYTVVYYNSKYYEVKDNDLVKSIDELMNLTDKKPKDKTGMAKRKPKEPKNT
jgi:hypothetical protein